jgi:hypothetical protein
MTPLQVGFSLLTKIYKGIISETQANAEEANTGAEARRLLEDEKSFLLPGCNESWGKIYFLLVGKLTGPFRGFSVRLC